MPAPSSHPFLSARAGAGLRLGAKRAVAALARAVSGRPRHSGLHILMYHRVNASHPGDRLSVHPREFAAQLELLATSQEYHVVTLESAVEALRGGAALGDGAVAITFDDGYLDNFDCALPLLDRFRLPATFFVATSCIGNRVEFSRYRGCCDRDRAMDWEHVRELRLRGHAAGGHGRTHRELAPLAAAEAHEEIAGSRDDLARETGVSPALFCYPRGSLSPLVERLVAEAGYRAACSVRPGANAAGVDLFALQRTEVSGEDTLRDFRHKLAGGFDAWHRLVQATRALGH